MSTTIRRTAGRGGWTWYTGSAGWMYRVGLEGILGLQRRGAFLTVNPCIPSSWPAYTIDWRFGKTHYTIEVENPKRRCGGVASVELDGSPVDPTAIPLEDDGRVHRVRVVLGAGASQQRAEEVQADSRRRWPALVRAREASVTSALCASPARRTGPFGRWRRRPGRSRSPRSSA